MHTNAPSLKKNQSRIRANGNGHGSEAIKKAPAIDPAEYQKLLEEVEELRVRANITNLTSIVSEADLKGDIISINEKFCQVSKYSRDELLGKPHNTTRHPDMPKETFRQMWATIGRGETFRGIIKNRAKDGTPYYVDAVVAPVLGENGKPKKYIGVRYDITEMETERQNMKGLFGAIDRTFAYVEFDTKGHVTKANPIFLQALGYNQEEIVGKHHRMFVEPAYGNSRDYVQFWDDLAGGKSHNNVFKRLKKDGGEIWIQAVYAPVMDEMGRVYKIVKIATDITKQKVDELNKQRQMEEMNRRQEVAELTNEGIFITANDNYLKLMEHSMDDIKGKHQKHFLDPVYAASPEYKQFWHDLNEGKFLHTESKRINKAGKEIWLQISYNPVFDIDGNVFKVVAYCNNITSRKVAEVLC